MREEIRFGIMIRMNSAQHTIEIHRNLNPVTSELAPFFEKVFYTIENGEDFAQEDNQMTLSEWFSIDDMNKSLSDGALFEARDDDELVGAIYIGKSNPISYPDGHKMELFILAVDSQYEKQGIASRLMIEAERFALEFGAHSILVNTHILMKNIHSFYLKRGFREMGILKNYYENGDAVFFSKMIR